MQFNVLNFGIVMNQLKHQHKKSLLYQFRTFRFAFNGLKLFFGSEIKSRIHLLFALLAIALGLIMHLGIFEWISVSFAIGLVFLAEILNTVIEYIIGHISPEKSEMARSAKDLSAAGVLVASVTALVIGLLVFIPKIVHIICYLC
jgi:diacylglycerol kinase